MTTEFTEDQISEAEEFVLINLEDGTEENPLFEDELFCNLLTVVHQQHKAIQHLNERLSALESSKPVVQSTKRQDHSDWRTRPVAAFQKAQLARHKVVAPATAGEAQDLLDSIKAKAKAA